MRVMKKSAQSYDPLEQAKLQSGSEPVMEQVIISAPPPVVVESTPPPAPVQEPDVDKRALRKETKAVVVAAALPPPKQYIVTETKTIYFRGHRVTVREGQDIGERFCGPNSVKLMSEAGVKFEERDGA